MTMITPSYLGETIEYSSLHACRSTLEDPTATRVVTAALTGYQVLAMPEVIARRQSICASCLDLQNARCVKCGCYYKTKIQLATERCPVGKWGE